MSVDYLTQETADKIKLEDASGYYLLETSTAVEEPMIIRATITGRGPDPTITGRGPDATFGRI